MVGAYGTTNTGGRGALLPAPGAPQAGKAVIARGPTRNTNGAKDVEGPPVTVFIGKFHYSHSQYTPYYQLLRSNKPDLD